MQFVYPSFLFALFAIAIPIIIHLFHFRRYKKIVFSDLRFLKQVQEQNKAKQKLKDWLVLLSRILAIIFLVLAFAQPFLPADNATTLKGRKAISIFVDNSFSMNNEGKEGNLLEAAKNKARAIVNSYGNDDQFQILTQDLEGRHQRIVNKTDALQWIDEIKISPASQMLSRISGRQQQALEKAGDDVKLFYVISDFQKQMCDAEQLKMDSATQLNFVLVTANEQHNLYVDSVWLTSPVVQQNEPATVKVRIQNDSKETAENILVTLKLNGQQKGLQNITCAAGSWTDVVFTFTVQKNGLQQGEVSIIDHPVTFDDKMYFSFAPVSSYRLLAINGNSSNRFISKLFENDPIYKLTQTNQNQIDYSAFSSNQLIILNEPAALSSGLSLELKKYIEEGGQLLVIPPAENASLASLNTLLTDLNMPAYGVSLKQTVKVSELNTQDPIFKNVFQRIPRNMDLPSITQFYALQRNNASKGKPLMLLGNGQPFVWQASFRKGNVILFSTPLRTEWSNLPQHALFVPLMLKFGMGKAQGESLYGTIGTPQWIVMNKNTTAEKLIRLWGNDAELMLQTSQRQGKTVCYLDQPLAKAGIYNLAPQGEKAPQQLLAMNFDRKESNLAIWPKEDMESFLSQWPAARIANEDTAVLQNDIRTALSGTPFWRYCIWLTLVFILIEILLLRLLK
jgi:hypothetical protein